MRNSPAFSSPAFFFNPAWRYYLLCWDLRGCLGYDFHVLNRDSWFLSRAWWLRKKSEKPSLPRRREFRTAWFNLIHVLVGMEEKQRTLLDLPPLASSSGCRIQWPTEVFFDARKAIEKANPYQKDKNILVVQKGFLGLIFCITWGGMRGKIYSFKAHCIEKYQTTPYL